VSWSVAEGRSILLIKTHALGDVLLTTPVIRALAKHRPGVRIVYLTGRWSAPALQGNPHLAELVTVDDRALFGVGLRSLLLGPIVARLRRQRFSEAVVFSASPLMHLLARATGTRFLAGFGPGRFLDGAVDAGVLRKLYAAEAYAELLGPLGVPADGLALDFTAVEPTGASDVHRFIGLAGRGTVAFFCGGGRNPRDSVPAKRWAPARFAELGNRLGDEGYRILLLGSGADAGAAAEVERGLSCEHFNACGRFTFAETGALLKRCRLTVTNDSAPLHLSYALLVPTVGLFGPSDHRLLLPKLNFCRAVTSTFPCSPCYGNSLFAGCDRSHCMEGIAVESVHAACRVLLESDPKNIPE
jgi:heptosyltransferase II